MYVEKEEKTKFEYNATNNEITQTTNTICQTIYEQARTFLRQSHYVIGWIKLY